jgi:hypothetical protein
MSDRPTVDIVADHVRARGYAVWPDFVSPTDLPLLASAARQLATSERARPYPKSTRVWDLYRHGPSFVDLLGDNRLCELVGTLLGEHYLLSDYSLNVVHPLQPVDDWHIDYPYNEMRVLVSGSVLGLQCVLALDDFDDTNGATQVVPHSHVSPTRPDGAEPAQHDVFQASAGSLLVMAAATWHRSGLNLSDQPRSAILLSFVERWVRPMSDPPGPGPWATTDRQRILFGLQRPPETINGVPV